jgi:hypothetical protein
MGISMKKILKLLLTFILALSMNAFSQESKVTIKVVVDVGSCMDQDKLYGLSRLDDELRLYVNGIKLDFKDQSFLYNQSKGYRYGPILSGTLEVYTDDILDIEINEEDFFTSNDIVSVTQNLSMKRVIDSKNKTYVLYPSPSNYKKQIDCLNIRVIETVGAQIGL